jgi:hypothetical protein
VVGPLEPTRSLACAARGLDCVRDSIDAAFRAKPNLTRSDLTAEK